MPSDNLFKKYIFLNTIQNQFVQNVDFSKTPIYEVAKQTYQEVYTELNNNAEIHDYIFKFYAYNEILASFRQKQNGIVSKDDLEIFIQYQDFINDFSKRVFSFILHACIAEARHCELLSNDWNSSNDEMETEMVEDFVEQTINNFKSGKKNKLFSSFLQHIKEYFDSSSDMEKYLKKTSKVKAEFLDYLYDYCDIPYDLPDNFKNAFNKSNNIGKDINPKALGMFKKAYAKGKTPIDRKKLQRFNDFWNFMENIYNTRFTGDGGSLQRDIIKKQMIEQSKIKNFSTEEVLDFLSTMFLEGFNYSGAYGGIAWSEIAKHALSFAQGKMNAEIFIDQALSLEHNGGQMFNKQFIFDSSFNSSYFRVIIEKENKSLSYSNISMDTKEFMLHLQNSSSVLSLAHIPKDWDLLTQSLNLQELKKIHPDLSYDIVKHFSSNFEVLKDFKARLKFLPEMKSLAKKIDYNIPNFDFHNMTLVAFEKNGHDTSSVEKALPINQLFSNILAGFYGSTTKPKIKNITPSFNLHDLNAKTSKKLSKNTIGGKAFGLVELINKGFNVPKALVFDTKTGISYLNNKAHFDSEFQKINSKISTYLVDKNKQPLLVSVRSGAPVSMPGMMDSILNVGIDDTTYLPLCSIYGKAMIDKCALSFMQQFCSSKLDLSIQFPKNLNQALDKFAEILIKNDIPCNRKNNFPLSKEQQVKLSVEAVFDSWNSPRAIAWRNEKKISHDMGTAATVQQMVFGNKNQNSLTCVIFSRDCVNGQPQIMGEYLVNAQGEDLVSGKKTPLPISQLKQDNPKIYQKIEFIAKALEEEKKAVQDLEITVEDNEVYVLQMRNAVVSPEAQLALAKELEVDLLDVVQPKHLIGEFKVDTEQLPQYNGLAASPGLISGIVVKNMKDIEKYKNSGKPLIFFSNQALPEHAPIMIATSAFITEFGGATSHAAILARSMDKPCVVGIGKQHIKSGTVLTIDAINGKIWKNELPIIVNQDNAIKLSKQLLKENNIDIPKAIPVSEFSLQSWTTQLSKSTVLNQPKNKKNKSFLNIAQKTALLLQMDYTKQTLKK